MELLKLLLRNAVRHKLRSSLTVIGVGVAVMAFALLRTVVSAWYAGVEASAANRLITRHAVSFVFPLPLAYRDRIAQIPGVTAVTFANWFSGVYIDKNQFFARLAVDSDTFFEVYPEFVVPPEQFEAFRRERNACIIGRDIARRYGLKIGDIMTLEGDVYPGRWEFVVRGIYEPRDQSTDPATMMFHYRYLDERVRRELPERSGEVGWYIVRIDDPENSAAISEAIDRLFANSRAETKTETERAFQQSFLSAASAVITAMNVMSFVIIGIILLVLGNTMVMSARERTHEYAVLKALGFSGRQLCVLIAGESLILSVLGSAVGLGATLPAVEAFEAALPKGWFPVFYVKPETILAGAAAGLGVGVLAALIPARRALATRIVEGLRYVG
ncbi:MAG TPA: FtsX-like permease family protein [candidate division Zixibacteria bacterium]|nr:FtsX-like permease family protein [candidate division Zixibacteria bacterium]